MSLAPRERPRYLLSMWTGPYPGDGGLRQHGAMVRDGCLLPALAASPEGIVVVMDDGAAGYPPSFSEELFGGAVRAAGPDVAWRVDIEGPEHNAGRARTYMAEEAARQTL